MGQGRTDPLTRITYETETGRVGFDDDAADAKGARSLCDTGRHAHPDNNDFFVF
jgi:hypothetical protein